jgi:STE24 endopeptidase
MLRMLLVLLLALAAETGFQLYLGRRQITHVLAHRAAVPADFAATMDLEAHQKAADYSAARLRVAMLQQVTGLILKCAFLLGGFDLLYDAISNLIGAGLLRSVVFILAFGALSEAVGLPFQVYRTFVVERRFGFNRTTPMRFLGDLLKAGLLGLVISVPLLLGAFWLMRNASGLWWLYAWVAFMLFTLSMSQAYPRFIAPLFNRFTPLQGQLRQRLEALMARCGFHAEALFVMDASKRSAKGNAYLTGFGRSKRIVLFDTLLAQHTEDEIEAVLAHELGHFKHRHILLGTLRIALVSFLAFFCFGSLGKQPWLTASLGLVHHDDALSLLVFLMWANAVGPFLGLASNWFSRRAEFQADAFARKMVGADPLVSALTKLTRDSAGTLTPDPLYALFEYSHPPVPVRVWNLRNAG